MLRLHEGPYDHSKFRQGLFFFCVAHKPIARLRISSWSPIDLAIYGRSPEYALLLLVHLWEEKEPSFSPPETGAGSEGNSIPFRAPFFVPRPCNCIRLLRLHPHSYFARETSPFLWLPSIQFRGHTTERTCLPPPYNTRNRPSLWHGLDSQILSKKKREGSIRSIRMLPRAFTRRYRSGTTKHFNRNFILTSKIFAFAHRKNCTFDSSIRFLDMLCPKVTACLN